MGLNAVQTPNATTIVFHLAKPFADFNYVVAIPQSAPVPPNKDTGTNYQLHPISTGPYKFQSYQLNKTTTHGAEHVLEGVHRPERQASCPARSSSTGT